MNKLLPTLLLLIPLALPAHAETKTPRSLADVCATLKVNPEFAFHGKRLEEIPDIREPELRRANQLLSTGCFGPAHNLMQAYGQAHPADPHLRYVLARFTWIYGSMQGAERDLLDTLRKNPDFASAKVLLAGIRFEQRRYEDARRLIDDAEKGSPTDLWVFMNRLRLEALEKPTPGLRKRLMEILRSKDFPPNAREEAADLGISLPRQTNEQVEEFMWARLDFPSSIHDDCKISALAQRLSEVGERFEQTRELLESERARNSNCLQHPLNRVLLAQAYLWEAAKISPTPSPANEALIDKATVALQANYAALRAYVEDRPQAAVLAPFLKFRPKREAMDAHGRTPLCNAVRDLDIEAALDLLDRGANPNGLCEGQTLLGHVMLNHANTMNARRQAVARILLSREAEPTLDELNYCRQPKYGDCHLILLPIVTREAE